MAERTQNGPPRLTKTEPSEDHWYQPLWTLVGGGIEPAAKTRRLMSSVMAEFEDDLTLQPSFPSIDQTKERRDMFVVKRFVLPFMYWKFMLRGRA